MDDAQDPKRQPEPEDDSDEGKAEARDDALASELYAELFSDAGEQMADAITDAISRVLTGDFKQRESELRASLTESFQSSIESTFGGLAAGALEAAGTRERGRDGKDEPTHPIRWIFDHNAFLAWLIQYVPDDSVWAFESVLSDEDREFVEGFAVEDDVNVHKATIFPDLPLTRSPVWSLAILLPSPPKWSAAHGERRTSGLHSLPCRPIYACPSFSASPC